MSKRGRRYLWACVGLSVGVAAWVAVEYYRWAIINWDNQETG